MATRSEVEMSDAEVDALLSRHETGVLALARDETPYAIPISYGFDKESRTAFLRLVSTPDSEKREFLASDPQARIVVYEEGDKGGSEEYASVVGVGTLHRVDLDDLTPETIAQYGKTQRPCSRSGPTGRKTSTSSCTGSNLSDSPAVRSSSTATKRRDSSAWVEVSSIAYKWCSWIVDWLLYRPRYRL